MTTLGGRSGVCVGGGGGGLSYSNNYPSVGILTLKAVTIKTVDSQAHFSGDPKCDAQKYSYHKKYSPF